MQILQSGHGITIIIINPMFKELKLERKKNIQKIQYLDPLIIPLMVSETYLIAGST